MQQRIHTLLLLSSNSSQKWPCVCLFPSFHMSLVVTNTNTNTNSIIIVIVVVVVVDSKQVTQREVFVVPSSTFQTKTWYNA